MTKCEAFVKFWSQFSLNFIESIYVNHSLGNWHERVYKGKMKDVILILGMHRSGTSALTRVLNLLGAGLPKSLLGQNDSNTKGHWESEPMIAEHEAMLSDLGSDWKDWRTLKWPRADSRRDKDLRDAFLQRLSNDYSEDADVVVVKEPRICRFASPYIKTLESDGLTVFPVLMVRNPLEVAASLQSRDGIEKLDALYLWLTHMLEAELVSRGHARSFVNYSDLLERPVDSAKRLVKEMASSAVSLPYTVKDVKRQIENYVSPDLKRQSLPSEATALDPFAQGWVNEAYGAFLILCENRGSAEALSKLDKVRASYYAAIYPLHHALSLERNRIETAHNDKFMKEIVAHEAAVATLQADMKRDWEVLQDSHKKVWAERDTAHQTEIEGIKEAHKTGFEDMQKLHQTEIDGIKEAHKTGFENMHKLYKTEIEDIRAAHKIQIDGLETAHNAGIEELQSWHREEIDKIKAAHDNERESLKTRISDLIAERERVEAQAAEQMNIMRDEFGDILRGAEAHAQTTDAKAQILQSDLYAVLNSTSWKLTGGLRFVMNLLKGVKTNPQQPRLDSDAPALKIGDKAD